MNKILINTPERNKQLIDSFGRTIDYLRISVTDRCNFRCTYCMPENMKFLPKDDLLTFEEMDNLCSLFIARGIKKIRLSGGEPLARKGLIDFISNLSRFISYGDLKEITLTTNGSLLNNCIHVYLYLAFLGNRHQRELRPSLLVNCLLNHFLIGQNRKTLTLFLILKFPILN